MASTTPPTVEIDPSCHSVYIRFKKGKVDKTVSQKGRALVNVDVDRQGEAIGIELIGVKEFSIAAIKHYIPAQLHQRLQGVDFSRARFMPACDCVPVSNSEMVPA